MPDYENFKSFGCLAFSKFAMSLEVGGTCAHRHIQAVAQVPDAVYASVLNKHIRAALGWNRKPNTHILVRPLRNEKLQTRPGMIAYVLKQQSIVNSNIDP